MYFRLVIAAYNKSYQLASTKYYRQSIHELFFFLCFRPVNLLTSQIQSIVRALHKQLREKSVKTRQVNAVSINDQAPEYTCTWTCKLLFAIKLCEA